MLALITFLVITRLVRKEILPHHHGSTEIKQAAVYTITGQSREADSANMQAGLCGRLLSACFRYVATIVYSCQYALTAQP